MTTESMKQRIRRVAAQASQKKGSSRRSARRSLITRLEKEAADVKSRSFEEDKGGGKGSAEEQYDRKKGLPKPKGDDPNLENPYEPGEGYPHSGDPAGLGSGGEDPKKSKAKQKALDEAAEENRKNTSEMEPFTHGDPSRPRPKLSSAKRRAWRKKKMAELKSALYKNAFNPEGDPEMKKMFSDMAADDAAAKKPKSKGVAPKEQLKPLLVLQQNIGKGLATFLPKLQEANSDLEMAVTGGKMQEIRDSLNKLMSVFQMTMQNVLIPHGGRIKKMLGVVPRQAAAQSKRFKVLHTRVARLDEELSRSRSLIRMAATQVRI